MENISQDESVKKTGGTAPLTSNLKMLTLLNVIAETTAPFGVSQLARLVGGGRSIVHRQLVTLVEAGWLKSDDQGLYMLTFAPVRLGQAALKHASIDQRIADEITKLADRLNEGVSLGTLDQDSVLIVGRGLPKRNVHVSLAHGQRFPIEDSALGLVLASYLSEAEFSVLEEEDIPLPTETERETTRAQGFSSIIDTEFDPIEILAVPVGRAPGSVRYALSAHWPQGRAKPKSVLSALEETARVIDDLTRQSAGMTAH